MLHQSPTDQTPRKDLFVNFKDLDDMQHSGEDQLASLIKLLSQAMQQDAADPLVAQLKDSRKNNILYIADLEAIHKYLEDFKSKRSTSNLYKQLSKISLQRFKALYFVILNFNYDFKIWLQALEPQHQQKLEMFRLKFFALYDVIRFLSIREHLNFLLSKQQTEYSPLLKDILQLHTQLSTLTMVQHGESHFRAFLYQKKEGENRKMEVQQMTAGVRKFEAWHKETVTRDMPGFSATLRIRLAPGESFKGTLHSALEDHFFQELAKVDRNLHKKLVAAKKAQAQSQLSEDKQETGLLFPTIKINTLTDDMFPKPEHDSLLSQTLAPEPAEIETASPAAGNVATDEVSLTQEPSLANNKVWKKAAEDQFISRVIIAANRELSLLQTLQNNSFDQQFHNATFKELPPGSDSELKDKVRQEQAVALVTKNGGDNLKTLDDHRKLLQTLKSINPAFLGNHEDSLVDCIYINIDFDNFKKNTHVLYNGWHVVDVTEFPDIDKRTHKKYGIWNPAVLSPTDPYLKSKEQSLQFLSERTAELSADDFKIEMALTDFLSTCVPAYTDTARLAPHHWETSRENFSSLTSEQQKFIGGIVRIGLDDIPAVKVKLQAQLPQGELTREVVSAAIFSITAPGKQYEAGIQPKKKKEFKPAPTHEPVVVLDEKAVITMKKSLLEGKIIKLRATAQQLKADIITIQSYAQEQDSKDDGTLNRLHMEASDILSDDPEKNLLKRCKETEALVSLNQLEEEINTRLSTWASNIKACSERAEEITRLKAANKKSKKPKTVAEHAEASILVENEAPQNQTSISIEEPPKNLPESAEPKPVSDAAPQKPALTPEEQAAFAKHGMIVGFVPKGWGEDKSAENQLPPAVKQQRTSHTRQAYYHLLRIHWFYQDHLLSTEDKHEDTSASVATARHYAWGLHYLKAWRNIRKLGATDSSNLPVSLQADKSGKVSNKHRHYGFALASREAMIETARMISETMPQLMKDVKQRNLDEQPLTETEVKAMDTAIELSTDSAAGKKPFDITALPLYQENLELHTDKNKDKRTSLALFANALHEVLPAIYAMMTALYSKGPIDISVMSSSDYKTFRSQFAVQIDGLLGAYTVLGEVYNHEQCIKLTALIAEEKQKAGKMKPEQREKRLARLEMILRFLNLISGYQTAREDNKTAAVRGAHKIFGQSGHANVSNPNNEQQLLKYITGNYKIYLHPSNTQKALLTDKVDQQACIDLMRGLEKQMTAQQNVAPSSATSSGAGMYRRKSVVSQGGGAATSPILFEQPAPR